MSWNAAAWNTNTWNAPAGGVLGTGTVAVTVEQRALLGLASVRVTVEQQVARAQGTLALRVEQRIVTRGLLALGVEQQVALAQGTLAAGIEQHVVSAAVLAITLEQRIADATLDGPLTGPATRAWSVRVFLAGADVSAALTGTVRVEAEESRARVADFTLRPAAGPVDLTQWIGAPVTLEVTQGAQPWVRLFTGWVDVPEYDPVTRLTAYRCHDRLQERLDAMTRAQIAALIGGEWSDGVFRDDASGYEYAQDRLSTVPAALDAGPDGALRVHAWAAGTPRWTLGAGQIVDETLRVQLASRADLVNQVTITAQARYGRRSHRQKNFRWVYSRPFASWLLDTSTLPTEDMIRAAADAAGWTLTRASFTRLPPSTTVQLLFSGETRLWIHNPDNPPFIVMGADLSLAARWTRTVTETYTVTVTAPGSVDVWGLVERQENANLSASAETDWAVTGDPENPDALIGYSDLDAAATDAATGDRYFDDVVRADVSAMLRTAIAAARAAILASHRQHQVEITVPLLADLDLPHTLRVATPAVTATGTVRHVVHALDMDSGEALTLARLAVSRGGAAVADSPILAPAPPPVPQPALGGPVLGGPETYLGRRWFSPPEQDDWVGYVGNYTIPDPVGAPAYEERFVVNVGEIPRDAQEAARAATHTVNIPSDELALAA